MSHEKNANSLRKRWMDLYLWRIRRFVSMPLMDCPGSTSSGSSRASATRVSTTCWRHTPTRRPTPSVSSATATERTPSRRCLWGGRRAASFRHAGRRTSGGTRSSSPRASTAPTQSSTRTSKTPSRTGSARSKRSRPSSLPALDSHGPPGPRSRTCIEVDRAVIGTVRCTARSGQPDMPGPDARASPAEAALSRCGPSRPWISAVPMPRPSSLQRRAAALHQFLG
mmetsp:Transcript_17878/g.37727  ORF Transcript_17878/g.37727 Transcript_17878/m.37727 type:complete len:225 (+) Transcript_17878:275-949(+)